MTRLPMHEARRRPVQRNPRNPAYCETGHNPISGEHLVYNRSVRWSRLGVFNQIFAALAQKAGKPDRIMIDATHLKAHRTAASLAKKGLFPARLGGRKAA